jgi:hypothetical protein
MPRKASKPRSKTPATEKPHPENPAALDSDERMIERPDGFYWEAKSGRTYGPFATRAQAEADMLSGGAAAPEEADGEGLHEAESELGINEWIDPDTGVPAEDHVPRIEDH